MRLPAMPQVKQHFPVAPPPPAPVRTPDLSPSQSYLHPEQGGLDAAWAWARPGGLGTSVTIVDIEYAWDLGHEDLERTVLEVPGSTMCEERPDYSDHGTAVVGLLGAVHNAIGARGICPEASLRVYSHCVSGYVAGAIDSLIPTLSVGDIVLLEAQNYGPDGEFLPVEWWPAEWQAIRRAVDAGVVVVACAGNGAIDLDDPRYDAPSDPSWIQWGWENSFKRTERSDSGSIMVGSGIPPAYDSPDTPDASRFEHSNFGSCVDAQHWGGNVASCGYGEPPEWNFGIDRRYTQFFGGTSGAAALITGLLACVQGMLKAQGLNPLTSLEARRILRTVGTPQSDAPDRPATQRVGPRATVREVYEAALGLR